MDRIRALDYMQKSGLRIPEAKRMVKAFENFGPGVEIMVNNASEHASVKIDAHTIANAKSIYRGLCVLERERRR
jgi:hypothetical protein